MVALAILGTALVAVFQLFSMTLRSTMNAEKYTKAVFYARSMLDESYSLPDVDKNSLSLTFDGEFKGKREVSVRSSSEDERVMLYEITVTVTWPLSGNLRMKGLRAVMRDE
ncbi:MAG: hypothetical protein M0Z79_09170 [Nitrospiraceae bacterium]|nr:hypothetical protein [Nitrospiraceae bacterium]